MNFRNPYKKTIELANEELKSHNAMLSLYEDEDGNFSLDIIYGLDFSDPNNFDITKYESCETYGENYFEDELDNLIIEAWHYALSKVNKPKKMYAIIKNCNYDFNIDIKVCATTSDKETAKIIFENEVEKEKEEQAKGDIVYDTESQTETSYEAYNDGYEATDGVRIFIAETDYIEKIS